MILFNLGAPSTPKDVEPFLRNFFCDSAILPLPSVIRWPFAAFIAWWRTRGAAGKTYAALGGGSPLLYNTCAQAKALNHSFLEGGAKETEYRVFVCMRYWHPMAHEVVQNVADFAPQEIVLLPLYPQYARATTGSALAAWHKAASFGIKTRIIYFYPTHPGFIAALCARLTDALLMAAQAGFASPRVLFSAHGLPEREIRLGDPYQAQCTATAKAVAQTLRLADWAECYQSRVGPLKWIGPSVEEELIRASRDGVAVVLIPHAFTQEHAETLIELDQEYAHKAKDLGVLGYFRAQTVGTHPDFIKALVHMVENSLKGESSQERQGCL